MPTLTCGTCSRSFAKKEHYVRHLRTHTQERPFACRECHQQFARRDTLKRHTTSHHAQSAALSSGFIDAEPSLQVAPSIIDDSITVGNAASVSDRDLSTVDAATLHTEPQQPFELPLLCPEWQWDPSFELGPDFDIEAFGTYDAGNATPSLPWLPLRSQPFNEQVVQTNDRRSSVAQSIDSCGSWFTRIPGRSQPEQGGQDEPRPIHAERTDFNRAALKTSLQHPPSEVWLPPTSTLNRWIHRYTTSLWHLIPIVHLPSFLASRAHPLLLLSICSLGALAEGSAESLEHASRLYEGVQKAILVSWNARDVYDPALLALIQAAAIGQTFAILSPKTRHLVTARSFHGTLCVSLETFQEAMTARVDAGFSTDGNDSQSLVEKWQDWVRAQTCIRISNALQCHDGEIAATFQRRPTLRMLPTRTMYAAPDSHFLASSADDWQRALLSDGDTSGSGSYLNPQNSAAFSSCAFLDSMLAEIMDVRLSQIDALQTELSRLETMLTEWYTNMGVVQRSNGFETLSGIYLLHSCFIHLLCDMDKLERFFGRDGQLEMDGSEQYIREWVITDTAKRCVIHTLYIAQLSAQLKVSDVAGLHLARTIYSAAIVLAVYAAFVPQEFASIPQGFTMRFEETATMNYTVNGSNLGYSTHTNSMAEHCKVLGFSLTSTLRSLGPWSNARRYAKTLDGIYAKLEL